MKIHFIGNTSTRARYECGVKGDGESETLEFDLAAIQDGFDIAACEACLLLAAKGESYGDKIALDAATDGERVTATYTLPAKVTRLGAVNASLAFEGEGGEVWQTKMFTLAFAPRTEWSAAIEEGYPNAIVELQNRVTAVEEAVEAETERAKEAEAGLSVELDNLKTAVDNLDLSETEIEATLDGDALKVSLVNVKSGEETSSSSVDLPYIKKVDALKAVDDKIKLVGEIDYADFAVGDNRLLKI